MADQEHDDRALRQRLRRMWLLADPSPPLLADQVLFALMLEDIDAEVLRLQALPAPVSARGDETARTITFTSESLSVLVTVSGDPPGPRRLDGYILPAGALRIELRGPDGRRQAVADRTGRFAFPELPDAPIQLAFLPTPGTGVDLGRPVVTPPVQL
jgi:hypothetical protein